MSKKYLVVSDSHGNNANLCKALSYFGPRGKELEMLIHLGDSQGALEKIEALADCKVEAVRGNCDASGLPVAKLISIGNKTALITHGHRYGCKSGTDLMKEMAKENGAEIVLFGHTHEPLLQLQGTVKVANPGSISLPRQPDRRPTYLVITIEDSGRMDFVIVAM